jgi:hypothetical protein
MPAASAASPEQARIGPIDAGASGKSKYLRVDAEFHRCRPYGFDRTGSSARQVKGRV